MLNQTVKNKTEKFRIIICNLAYKYSFFMPKREDFYLFNQHAQHLGVSPQLTYFVFIES